MILAGPHGRTFLTGPWFSTRPGYYQGEPIAAGIGDLPGGGAHPGGGCIGQPHPTSPCEPAAT